jgi:hypothetical protein
MEPEPSSDEDTRHIRVPERSDAKVWRYMSFVSLVSIVQLKQVFFTRIANLDDPYEGSMPEALRSVFGDDQKEIGGVMVSAVDFLKIKSRFSCVNCWHVNGVESAAMWKLYSSESGVAIQSSIGGLLRGFNAASGLEMALVEYVDFDATDLPKMPYPIYLKRRSFSHENELRLVITDADTAAHPDGLLVSADLSQLIERIYVSPLAPFWMAQVVRRELEQYGLEIEVIHSSLYSKGLK